MVCSCDLTINAHGFGEGLGPITSRNPALQCEGANEEIYISRTEVWPVWDLPVEYRAE